MDNYPQPRPVLYGTSEDAAPPQTQTKPSGVGPPRYPPAPPMAGDAPDPFEPSRQWHSYLSTSDPLNGRMLRPRRGLRQRITPPLVLLYALYLVVSILFAFLNIEQFAFIGAVAVVAVTIAIARWLLNWYFLTYRSRRWQSGKPRSSITVSTADYRGWRNRW